jgi:hypothetical protein
MSSYTMTPKNGVPSIESSPLLSSGPPTPDVNPTKESEGPNTNKPPRGPIELLEEVLKLEFAHNEIVFTLPNEVFVGTILEKYTVTINHYMLCDGSPNYELGILFNGKDAIGFSDININTIKTLEEVIDWIRKYLNPNQFYVLADGSIGTQMYLHRAANYDELIRSLRSALIDE